MNFVPCNNFPNDPEHQHLIGKPCPKCGVAGAQQAARAPVAVSPVAAPTFTAARQVSNPTTGSALISAISFLVKVAFALVVWMCSTFGAFMTRVARFSASRVNPWEQLAIWAGAIAFCLLIFALVGWAGYEFVGWLAHLITTSWQNATNWLDHQWFLFTYRVGVAVDRFTQWLLDLLNLLLGWAFVAGALWLGLLGAVQIVKTKKSK